MTKRTQQQPPKHVSQSRKGVTVVFTDGNRADYKDALGWNWDQSGILTIAGEKIIQNDNVFNETLVSIKNWSHVTWTSMAK